MSGNGIGALCVEAKCQRRDQIDDAFPGQGLLTISSLAANLILGGKYILNMADFSEKLYLAEILGKSCA